MAGPLAGIKVVEMGVWVAGPAAGGILSDWGADVIKLEPPGVGDPARMFRYMLGGDLPFNPVFENDNRSKRSIVADLRKEEGRQIAIDLIRQADVFVSNIRPAALARLGLDPESLCKRFPRLIYAVITGYGREGPESDRAAYDIAAFWARSGIAASLAQPGSPPPHQRGGMGDHNVGLAAAAGISAALFQRERDGKGQVVSTSLLRQGIYTLSFDMAVAMRYGLPIRIVTERRWEIPRSTVMPTPRENTSGSSASRASATGRRSRARPVIPSGFPTRAMRTPATVR